LVDGPNACLISSSISEKFGIESGDQIGVSWEEHDGVLFTVYAVVDYWPSWSPCKDVSKPDASNPMLVVVNLSYIQENIALEPYEVWLKLEDDAKSATIYEGIEEKGLPVLSLTDARQEIIHSRKAPSKLAINGTMTLGFIISGVICFLGFILYWVLSFSSRTLQFGILRGMGMSMSGLALMMIWEQILTSGVAMVIGVFIGLQTSRIFVPLFQMADHLVPQVLPFKVISYAGDRIKIYILIFVTLGLGLLILSYLIWRIEIYGAIKLGED